MKRSVCLLQTILNGGFLVLLAAGSCFGVDNYSWSNMTGTMHGKPYAVNGTATFNYFGRAIPMQYTLDSASRFSAIGSWSGPDSGWKKNQNLPGSEYRIVNPRLTLTVSNTPASLKPILSIGALELRTIAKRADGNPIAHAVINPAQIPVSFDGGLTLPLPRFPSAQPIITNPLCNASCGLPRGATLPGSMIRIGGLMALPAGTRIADIRLDYVDNWRNQCEIFRKNIKGQEVGSGDCKNDSLCLPGQNREQGNQPTRCVTPAPTLPQLPATLTVTIDSLLR